MSLDALRLVSEYMTPAGRIKLAQLDAHTCGALTRWEDVHSLLFDDTKIIMAGDVFRHQVGSESGVQLPIDQSFRLCPHARHVWIQTRLRSEQMPAIQKQSAVIESLYVSSENFDTRYPLNWEKVSLKRLRSVNILQRMDQPLNLKQVLDPSACQALFPITLRHVCLTGVILSSTLMDTLLTLSNLCHLDLIGCVIDTNLAASYVEKLGRLPNLDELSMPPSMFSFSVKDQNDVRFSLRKLRLSKLAIYMEQFDENTFFEQLETMMPRKLEVLVLFGNYFALKKSKKYSQWRRFEILFGAMTPQVRTQWWMRDDALLMSHFVRSAPYKIAEDFRPIRNTTASWRFDQVAAETEESRLERQQPANRILRFMRPEPQAAAPAAPPRPVPEAPPPPAPVRRERVRRRQSVPGPAEEQNQAMPVMLALPPDGAASAPIGFVIPLQAPPQQTPATSADPQQASAAEHPPEVAAVQPANPVMQPVATTHPGLWINPAADAGVVPRQQPGQSGHPNAQRASVPQAPAPTAPQSLSGAPVGHQLRVEEVPPETPATPNQPQPAVQSPTAVATQQASPVGQVEGIGIEPVVQQGAQTQALPRLENGGAPNMRPDHAPLDRPDEHHEVHPDEENINLMLQGMLQALVEEIVFDAMNEERMENTVTEPSPAVSSNVTRTASANHTSTPVTPPPTELGAPPPQPSSNSRSRPS